VSAMGPFAVGGKSFLGEVSGSATLASNSCTGTLTGWFIDIVRSIF